MASKKELQIAKRLAELREAKDMNKRQLGVELASRFDKRFHDTTVYDLESGKQRLDAEAIVELCDILDCTPNDLLITD